MYGAPKATITILSNDNAGGTFRFAAPFAKSVDEGVNQSFRYVFAKTEAELLRYCVTSPIPWLRMA